MRNKFAVGALLVILVLINWAIAGKERQLATGEIVYLRLAPVDPRSLMQGDYMRLHFQIADQVGDALDARTRDDAPSETNDNLDGQVVLAIDTQHIGTFRRLADNQTIAADELPVKFRVRGGKVMFATNAFFFQEGDADIYATARYGQFRVADSGELLLVGMYDEELKELGLKTGN